MSARDDAWTALGIAPTDDERAIRVAYSARLKAFDPDSDPQAFVALREARDMALHLARRTAREAAAAAEPRQDATQAHDAREPEPEAISQAERHAQDLYAMFYAERDPERASATHEEREAMLAHWQGIVADPRLQEIGFFAQLEHWTIGLIAHHLPLSDPLIIPATELFEWTASDDTVAQSREVAVITARYGWLSYIEEVQQPDHPWYPLWEELNKPGGPGAKRARLGPARVRTLIQAVRAMRPDLEERFDPARIALWEPQGVDFAPPQREATSRPSRGTGVTLNWQYVIGAFLFLGFISNLFKGSSPPPPRYDPYEQRVIVPAPPPMPALDQSRQMPTFMQTPAPNRISPDKTLEALRAYVKKHGVPRDGEPIVLGNTTE